LSNPERSTLAEIGKTSWAKRSGVGGSSRQARNILARYRRLIANKFDGSKYRSYPGRPRIAPELEALILKIAKEKAVWAIALIVFCGSPCS